jgi:hypothetical protein
MNDRRPLPIIIEDSSLKDYKSDLTNEGIRLPDEYPTVQDFIKENDPRLPNSFSFSYNIKKDIIKSYRNVEVLLGNLSNSRKSLKNIIHPNHQVFVASILSSTIDLLCEDIDCFDDLNSSAICLETVVALKDINGVYQKVLICVTPFEFDENSMLYSVFCFCKVISEYKGEGLECKFVANPNANVRPRNLNKFNNCITEVLTEIKDRLFTKQQLRVLEFCEKGKTDEEICSELSLRPRTLQQYEYQMLESAELVFEYKKFRRIDELTGFLDTLYLSGSCRY